MEAIRNMGQPVQPAKACSQKLASKLMDCCNKFPRLFGGPLTRTGIPEIDAQYTAADSATPPLPPDLQADSNTDPRLESAAEGTVPGPVVAATQQCPTQGEKTHPSRQDPEDDSGAPVEQPSETVREEALSEDKGLTWWQTAFLMTGEFVGTSTHTFPHIFATLGFFVTTITLLSVVVVYWFTSKTVWRAKLRNPEAKNICELGVSQFRKAWLYWIIFALVQICYLVSPKPYSSTRTLY